MGRKSLERTHSPLRPGKEFNGTRPAQVRNLSSAIAGKSDWRCLSCNKLQEFIFGRGAWDPSGNQHPRRSVCKVRYRKASQLLWCLCSVGFQEHHNKTKSEWSRKLWNAAGRSLHSHCGPHQAARKNYRQRQHHREPSRAFQPREGGLVLRTERQYQQLDRKKTTTWTP